jgi:hypothetical protein
MAATEIVAVLDAGPLIHLDELGRLILLNDFKELLGLILRSRRRGKISKAEMLQLLRELPMRTTLHLRKELLESILATAAAENP